MENGHRDFSDMERSRRAEFWTQLALLIMILVTVFSLLLLPAQFTLFNPEVYKQELDRLNFYQNSPVILGRTLAGGENDLLPGLGDKVLGLMDAAHYDQVFRLIFPEQYIRAQTESLIDQFWAFFNLHTPDLHLRVDLRPVKERLTGSQSQPVAQAIVSGLPPCKGDELFQFGANALQGKLTDLPLCRPPEELLNVADQVVGALMGGAASLAPDQVDLAGVIAWQHIIPVTAPKANQPDSPLWDVYKAVRLAGPWLPVISVLCLAVILYSGRFTWRGSLFWTGAALAVPAFVTLVIALLLAIWSSQSATFLVQHFFLASLAVIRVLIQLAQAVMIHYVMLVGEVSLGLTLFGIALMVVAVYRKNFA